MLIVRIRGGLGNQLFQYAFARSLNLRTGYEVKLDAVSSFRSDFYERRYSLQHFKIRLPVASAEELRRLVPRHRADAVWRRLRRTLVTEKDPRFDPVWLAPRLKGDKYLIGFWQSEKYFIDVGDDVRRELGVRYALEGRNRELAGVISSTNSVAVHVRRLHGVSEGGQLHEQGVKRHGGCSIEYYEEAMRRLVGRIGSDAVFFVFADDIAWSREHVPQMGRAQHFVDHNGFAKDFEDLRLMSLCRHQVIANSTFSWWGAWLNANEDKIVVAPEMWVHDETFDTSDLIPAEWMRLPST